MSTLSIVQSRPRPRGRGRKRKRSARQTTLVVRKSRPRKRSRMGSKSMRRGRRGTAMSPYLRSLIYPEHYQAKIPDVNNYPSTTFAQVMDGSITSSSVGAAAAVFYPIAINPSWSGSIAGPVVTAGGTVAAPWNASQTIFGAPNSAAIAATFALIRPVSGVLELEFIGSTSSDQGQVCVTPVFRGESGPAAFSNAVSNALNVCVPLRNGVRFLWKPMDNADLEYEPCNTGYITGMTQANSTSVPNIQGATADNGTEMTKVGLYMFVLGAATSSTVLRFRWTVNFEAVPTTDTLALFDMYREPSNPSILSNAMDYVAELPWGTAWQKAGGLVDAYARETLQAQLPNLLGAVGAAGVSALRRRSQPRLTYDYPVD